MPSIVHETLLSAEGKQSTSISTHETKTLELTQPLANELPIEGAEARPAGHSEENKTAEALRTAMELLSERLRPYMPLHREPGKLMWQGVDLVAHSEEEKPFTAMGNILMAARLLHMWEKYIGDGLKSRIEFLDDKIGSEGESQHLENASISLQRQRDLMKASLPHQPLSQPIAYALTLAKDKRAFPKHVVLGGGMVFTKETYLRRLELENLVYRQHMLNLEQDMYMTVLADVSNVLELDKQTIEAARTSAAKIGGILSSQPKQPAAQGNSKQANRSLAPKISASKASSKHKIDVRVPKQPPSKRRKWIPSRKTVNPVKTEAAVQASAPKVQGQRQQPRAKLEVVDLTEIQDERPSSDTTT